MADKRELKRDRKSLSEEGMARFEVLGRAADCELIRAVARRLAENDTDSLRIRSTIRSAISAEPSGKGGILAALRRSLLVGADLAIKRSPTPSRKVEL